MRFLINGVDIGVIPNEDTPSFMLQTDNLSILRCQSPTIEMVNPSGFSGDNINNPSWTIKTIIVIDT